MSSNEEAWTTLAASDASLAKVMQAVALLEGEHLGPRTTVGISGAVTLEMLGVPLRRHALLAGCALKVVQGNFDDPVGDMGRFAAAGVEHVVLWPHFDTLLPAFEARLPTLEEAALEARLAEVRARYRLALEKASGFKAVYVGTFHRMGRTAQLVGSDPVERALSRFNQALRDEAAGFPNVSVLDADDVLRSSGRAAAFDWRFYFKAKAPYASGFLAELARRVTSLSRAYGTRYPKVLVLDADNTLWGGVIGEDLLKGIKLGPHDEPGSVFWRAQQEFSALERSGVLLALCTKNNPADVAEVFRAHPDMVLQPAQLVTQKANWEDKPTNLRAIAAELNVGLDSLVFLDDSPFECEAVRRQLPMVRVFQVPSPLSRYPHVIDEIRDLFLAAGVSEESRHKTAQYRQRASAEQERAAFGTQEDYLASLGLTVKLSVNARASIPRISELSLKSNQFNLTTRRYSEAEVLAAMEDPSTRVYSLVVGDKFGSAGLTGIAVVRYVGRVATVENFLMSCRVIGRGVETSVWEKICADARARGCEELHARFVPTPKNEQVREFYDRLGLEQVSPGTGGVREYRAALAKFSPTKSSWIEMKHVE